MFFVGLVFLLFEMAEVQAGGRHRGGHERTDWENLYRGRRPDPPVGQFYGRYDTWQGPRSYTHNIDRLPPPHFYHRGYPGYNMGGQQVVIVNNGYGGYQALDYRTAMIMGSFQTLSQLLAYLLSQPPAQAAPIPQNYQVPPQPAQTPVQQDYRESDRDQVQSHGAGIYVFGKNQEAVRFVKEELVFRGKMIVDDQFSSAEKVEVIYEEVGDPVVLITLKWADRSGRKDVTAGADRFSVGSGIPKWHKALSEAVRQAVSKHHT